MSVCVCVCVYVCVCVCVCVCMYVCVYIYVSWADLGPTDQGGQRGLDHKVVGQFYVAKLKAIKFNQTFCERYCCAFMAGAKGE